MLTARSILGYPYETAAPFIRRRPDRGNSGGSAVHPKLISNL
jgi:hypothetical protein